MSLFKKMLLKQYQPKWENLLGTNCPMCGSTLDNLDFKGIFICYDCNYVITHDKFKDIVRDLKLKQKKEEDEHTGI